MKVATEELRAALECIFDHLDAAGLETCELQDDYYWEIATEDRYAPYRDPEDLTLGQLSSDLDHVRDLARGQTEPLAYSLVAVSAILRCIGERTKG